MWRATLRKMLICHFKIHQQGFVARTVFLLSSNKHLSVFRHCSVRLSCIPSGSRISATEAGLPHRAGLVPAFRLLLHGPRQHCSRVLRSSAARQRAPRFPWILSSSPSSPPRSPSVTVLLSWARLQLLWDLSWFSVSHLYPPPITSVVWGLSFYFFLVIFTLKNDALWFFQELRVSAVPSFWAVSFSVGALQNFPSPFVSWFRWSIVLCR